MTSKKCDTTEKIYPGHNSTDQLLLPYLGQSNQYETVVSDMNYFFDFDEKLPECAMDRCGLYVDDKCSLGINDGDFPGISILKYSKNSLDLFGVKAKESI